MPRKKKQTVTFSVTSSIKNGFKQDTQLRVLALFFWDEKLQTYTLYGLSECKPSYQKLVKTICQNFSEDEEISIRLWAGEVLCVDCYFINNRFQRCDVRLDRVPDDLISRLRSNVDQVVLKERRTALIEREQENLKVDETPLE